MSDWSLDDFRRILPIAMANTVTALRQYEHVKGLSDNSRPNIIHVMLNNRCNLSCRYCDIWKNNGEDDLSTEQWLALFDELLTWTRYPKLNLSGGEPFLRKDIFEILDFCVQKGGVTGVVTNGWAMTPKMAPRVVSTGLANLNISLDSLDENVSDYMRGKKGHTTRTIESILRVMDEVAKQRSNMKVYLKTVVCGSNLDSLIPLVEFVKEQGLSGISFQPLEAVLSRKIDYADKWHLNTPLWPKNQSELAKAEDVFSELITLKQNGSSILNPENHIKSWIDYFRDPIGGIGGQTASSGNPTCHVGHTHLYINSNGTFKLCWDYEPLGNAVEESFAIAWKSQKAEAIREKISNCTAPCTKTCLLDRGYRENLNLFLNLMKPNDHDDRQK